MNEKTYERITKLIRNHKYGVEILKLLNKITTSLVYLIYPVFVIMLAFNRDKRFWNLLNVYRYYNRMEG